MCSILLPPGEVVDCLPFLPVHMHYVCSVLAMVVEVAMVMAEKRGALLDRSLREEPSHVLSIQLVN